MCGGFDGSLQHFGRDLSRWRCCMERLSVSERNELWDVWEAGESETAKHANSRVTRPPISGWVCCYATL